MEILPSDAETLRKMVAEEWFPHDERELEATFGADGVVDSTRFLAVAQRLKSKGYMEVRQPDRLTISLEDNTRYTIQGEGTIAQYCDDNTLSGKAAVAMIKDRAGNLHTLDLKEYDTRVKIRREVPLDMNDPRVKSHLATWSQRVKFFRLIQRWTFTGNGVIFDLSMVRSTKKDDRGLWKQVTKFYDEDKHHNILKEMPSYEIEVELEHGTEFTDTPAKAQQVLIQGLGEILRGIQRNPILIRNSVKEKVLEGYKTLVGASEEPGRRGFRGVQPVTLEMVNFSSMNTAKPNIRKGYNVTDKADGLRVMGYCNDKGELFMLDMSLNVYRTGLKKLRCANTLVDGEWITRNKDNEGIQMLMLFDIYYGINGEEVSRRGFYSSFPQVATRHGALLEWCAAWREEGGPISLVKGLTPQNSLKVMDKKFLFAEGSNIAPSTDIFIKATQILNRVTNYNTDGLIFTDNEAGLPDRFGVRFNNQFKWKPSEDNTIDFLVKLVKDPETNQDKLTDSIRPDSQDTVKYKTLRLYIGSSADPAYDDPRRTILMIKKLPSGRPGGRGAKKHKMRPVLFSPKEYEDSMASVCYLEAQEEMATGEWVVRCSTPQDGPGEATGDPITNNSIVEMRYDPNPSLPSGWNWVPIRVRYDKTERFQSGAIDKTLNSVDTADSVWRSIHNPITVSMITSGNLVPSEEEKAAVRVQQEREASMSHRYYQKKSSIQNVSLVKNMANFHNLTIKGDILTRPILANTSLGLPLKKKVIDTSVGKGGDLGRYADYVSFLLGIDLDADGIRDPDEGAYRRYLNRLVEAGPAGVANVPPMLFLIGDSTKSYMDGKSGINEEEADMMRATFGKVPPAAKVPPYIDSKCRGQLKEGADFVTSMFSIHYYFESKERWEGFLNNLRDNLKVGGFFVCCCFDGDILVNKLSNLEKGQALEGKDEVSKATLWKITKQNNLDDRLPGTDEEGFGHAIDVEFLSIGSAHREYLVSKQLLIDQMNTIGCELVNAKDCGQLGIPVATQTFEKTYESNPGLTYAYPMQPSVQQFSFFNRWFIFRRYGTAPGAAPQEDYNASDENEYGALPPGWFKLTDKADPTRVFYFNQESGEVSDVRPGLSPGAAAAGPFVPRSPEEAVGPYVPRSPNLAPAGFAPRTPNSLPALGPATPPLYGVSPTYRPTSPAEYAPASPVWEPAAAALAERPASAAWASLPLSGNAAENDALRVVVPGAGAAAASAAGPYYAPTSPPLYGVPGFVRDAEAASPPFRPSSPEPGTLSYAAQNPEAAGSGPASGLVTAVVQGGSRTVAVERGPAAGPQKKYKPGEIFRFFGRAELKDNLGINDEGAARWLALSAPFPIKDKGIEYPSVNHYLAGMKYKLATDKPELAEDLFSSKGTIHIKYLRLREQIANKHKGEKEARQVKEHEDQELLRAESADVSEAALPKTIKRYKASFDEARWLAEKDEVLKEALKQRWMHDARFRRIVEAARTKEKYLLYYTGSSTITSFGGVRREDGRIEGENQVGKIIMELAGYPPM